MAILCGNHAPTRTCTEAFELPEEAVMMLKMAIPDIRSRWCSPARHLATII
jgi:hypothetical protein